MTDTTVNPPEPEPVEQPPAPPPVIPEPETLNRGVVVDAKGKALALVTWGANDRRPRVGRPNTPAAQQSKFLVEVPDEPAFDPASWRYNRKRRTWEAPDLELHLVRLDNGHSGGRRRVFSDDVPVPPRGFRWVTQAPPKSRARKPYWNGTEWTLPHTALVIDEATGVVVNAIVERPERPVDAPPGFRVVRPSEIPDGVSPAIGWTLRADGSWEEPAPEPAPAEPSLPEQLERATGLTIAQIKEALR